MTDLMTGRRGLLAKAGRRPPSIGRPGATGPAVELGPQAILLGAAWFGSVVGLLELGLLIALKPLHDPTPGFFRMNRHAVWMIPVGDLLLFSGCGVLLSLAARYRPRL